MGKTLERRLGEERLQALLGSVKPGCVVAVVGRPQAQPQRQLGGDGTGRGTTGDGGDGGGGDVIDVVVHEVQVLFSSK